MKLIQFALFNKFGCSIYHTLLATFLLCVIMACSSSSSNKNRESPSQPKALDKTLVPQFELHQKDHTGLDFENVLQQSSEFNVFNYMYFFNGGGVSVGDFNQDGKQDVFFTSNMGSNKLFLNEGNLQFKDVTEQAQLAGMDGWTAGCSVVDINNDGMLDIYVSQMGEFQTIKGRNQLYVCQKIENGIPVFEDKAADYGLDFKVFGTQSSFFDYDLDGDLDLFLLNHSLHANGTFGQKKTFVGTQHPESGDKLLRNDDGKFTDITLQAGINSTVIGYGLGLATGDINLDGYPDIYIGNDFHENDYLYLNQKDGTFKEVLEEQIRHTSRFSMGVDMADINNDGWSEIISLDMLSYDPFILKTSLGEDDFKLFNFKMGYGYNAQFARNNLQLNNGDGTFSEIGRFANVYATDWSWTPLLFDFDHDGYRDLFISNGIPRRMNDIDYINFRSDHDLRFKQQTNNLEDDDLTYISKMPQIKLPNKFFCNQKTLQFQDIETQIINNQTSYSNGAAYADFDGDGDLDVVVNNIDDAPFLYENLQDKNMEQSDDYIAFSLKGSPQNRNAIGAKVLVFKQGERLTYEHFPVRGYQSSVQMGVHIGVGDKSKVDSVLVVWQDLTYQKIAAPKFNTTSTLTWTSDLPNFDFSQLQKQTDTTNEFTFTDITQQTGINFTHKENPFVEFDREGLIPHMVSAEGPALAVGDVNQDGLEDVFLGSSKRKRSALYVQQSNGKFRLQTPDIVVQDSIFEDVDAQFADIDQDQDLDLVIASGGNEYRGESEAMKQRVYLNDGKGNFTEKYYFPDTHLTAACVLLNDFDKDGDLDAFFGARALPWNYGLSPQSHLLENQGDGTFKNISNQHEVLQNVGLVKNGTWTDLDQDGDADLVLAMEWDAVTVLWNQDGKAFEKMPLNDAKGWWNTVHCADFDGDGDVDILAGNLGSNSKFRPTANEPLTLYINDFDGNNQVEQILTHYVNGMEYPYATYAELTKQLVGLKKQYLLSKDLATASLSNLFGAEKLKEATVREVNYLQSAYFENKGGKKPNFEMQALPGDLQLSTINTFATVPNADRQAVIIGGNFQECNIEMGWYDASYGNILSFDQNKNPQTQDLGTTPLMGQTRRIRSITINGKSCFIAAKNDGKAQVLMTND